MPPLRADTATALAATDIAANEGSASSDSAEGKVDLGTSIDGYATAHRSRQTDDEPQSTVTPAKTAAPSEKTYPADWVHPLDRRPIAPWAVVYFTSFSWLNGIMHRRASADAPLQPADLLPIARSDEARALADRLEAAWLAQLAKEQRQAQLTQMVAKDINGAGAGSPDAGKPQHQHTGKLWRAYAAAFGGTWAMILVRHFFLNVLMLLEPYLLGRVVALLQVRGRMDTATSTRQR